MNRTLYSPDQIKNIIGIIEIINDIGLNVVWIDQQYYIFTTFTEIQDGIFQIEVIGKNATQLIENSVAQISFSEVTKNELLSQIMSMKDRRRQFSPDTQFSKYLANA